MNSKFLLASSLCLLLVGWTSPAFNHSDVALSATFDKTGVQPEVKAGKNADIFVTDQVKRALANDREFARDVSAITIVTEDGVVTLTGPVSSSDAKVAIEQKVANVPGVKSVNNKLDVKK